MKGPSDGDCTRVQVEVWNDGYVWLFKWISDWRLVLLLKPCSC